MRSSCRFTALSQCYTAKLRFLVYSCWRSPGQWFHSDVAHCKFSKCSPVTIAEICPVQNSLISHYQDSRRASNRHDRMFDYQYTVTNSGVWTWQIIISAQDWTVVRQANGSISVASWSAGVVPSTLESVLLSSKHLVYLRSNHSTHGMWNKSRQWNKQQQKKHRNESMKLVGYGKICLKFF